MGKILEFYQNDRNYKDRVNLEVIKFIDAVANFPDLDGHQGTHITHLFCNGYCYYFANMLKTAFGGRICWPQDRGHIVWVDCDEDCSVNELQNAIAYDITGVFQDYKRLWPVEYLGETIAGFIHSEYTFHLNTDFAEACEFYKISEIYAITLIWECMPEEEILSAYKNGMNLVDTAYQYWISHHEEFARLFEINKRKASVRYLNHIGITEYLSRLDIME